LVNPIIKTEESDPKPLTFMEEMKMKINKLKEELSCKSKPEVKQPTKKPESIQFESVLSSAYTDQEAPSTPLPRVLNEDGEYE
jgi:hypothetical protein